MSQMKKKQISLLAYMKHRNKKKIKSKTGRVIFHTSREEISNITVTIS